MHLHLRALAVHLHLKLLAELGFTFVVALAVLIVFVRGTKKTRVTVAALLALFFAGYEIRKHTPPFEEGNHDSVVQASMDGERSDLPHLGPCQVFPANNVWNTPIETLHKDKHAQDYVDSIGPLHPVHPDFGSSLESGMPYTLIPATTKRVKITFDYREDSDLSNYPIPPDAPIENGPDSKGDRHVLLVDENRCLLFEIYDAHPKGDGTWTAGSGIIMDLTSNALRTEGKTSADAAGLPILPGLVRYDEVMAGAINHALRFTVPHTQAAYIWPARHKASHITDLKVPPMGQRFRLRADFDISKYSKTNQVIMKALKKYGMFLADNGSAMFISGVSDKRWDDADLHKLGDMKAEDFEAVDESDWQMMEDSARVDPLAVKR
jgi:hypothetical protein